MIKISRSNLFLGLFFLILAGLYAYRLNFPGDMYYDEVYHVKTAREFVTLSGNTDTSHPPLGKEMIAASIILLGDKPWVWRSTALLCGLGSLFIFFLLARRFFKDEKAALAALFLLALDGISITQSRIAMLNTTMFLSMLLSLWFFIRGLDRGKFSDWLGTGLFFGLAFATRWVGAGIFAVLLLAWFTRDKETQHKPSLLTAMICFVLVPAIIYFASHWIFLFLNGYTWKDLFTYQVRMLQYHAGLKAGHNYGSAWWSWPIMSRPIWYFFERKESTIFGILCIGNPAVFWMFFPALGYLVWNLFKTGSRQTAFVLAGYFSQWMPWAVIGRVKFFHYYYSCMPFVALALVLYLKALCETGRRGRIFAAVYLALVLGMFFYWYPLYVGYPIGEKYFQNHLWFKSWI